YPLLIIDTGFPVNKCRRYQRNEIHKRRNRILLKRIFAEIQRNSGAVGVFGDVIAVRRRSTAVAAYITVGVGTYPDTTY
ncbi:MAG: hypothetical protein MUO33_04190, partial [Sedimentisphaerales bacterium]|nr:hypothetical protein [Sedimentisphaerales bacterium]